MIKDRFELIGIPLGFIIWLVYLIYARRRTVEANKKYLAERDEWCRGLMASEDKSHDSLK